MVRGKFITFEGIDGAGKSTHIERFAEKLRARGLTLVVTREPGGTPLAERLRELLLNSHMDPMTEVLLAFAARQEHVKQVILPALDEGHWVICDRFTDSSFAYQGGGRGIDWSFIQNLEAAVHPNLQPDLTILFDLSSEEAARRRANARQADRFEAEDLAFFGRVREAYGRRLLEQPMRFLRIDAAQERSVIQVLLDEFSLTI
jgi:dTMP kinase